MVETKQSESLLYIIVRKNQSCHPHRSRYTQKLTGKLATRVWE